MNEVHAEFFPEDKLKIVDEMKTEYGLVAMVRDGVNDAPVLAASDVVSLWAAAELMLP
ncbi:MAG: HAD family hydrolase [Candidatus Bathyarchaeia archaeon]